MELSEDKKAEIRDIADKILQPYEDNLAGFCFEDIREQLDICAGICYSELLEKERGAMIWKVAGKYFIILPFLFGLI